MSYCNELPFGITSPNSYLNIETMNIYSYDYYNNIDDADFVNIYDGVEDYFLNYYGYVDDDEIRNCKKRIIEQWRM